MSMKGKYGADWSAARPSIATLTRPRTVTLSGGVSRSLPYGLEFACRYLLDDGRDKGKALKRAEAVALSAAGIGIVANFEYATEPPLTSSQGRRDALTARAELEALGAPAWAPVYFSFDYNVPATDLPGILSYLEGAHGVLGLGRHGERRAGAYGGFRLVSYLSGHGYRWLWQTYGWSGRPTNWHPAAAIRQIHNGAFPGEFDGDLNIAMADDIGAWSLTAQEETDMDMDTATPAGGDTHGMTFGELCGVMVRGANAASVARQGVSDLASAFRLYIAEDTGADAAVLARLDAILSATADPVALAAAIAGALPADLARQVVHELGTAIAAQESTPGA